MMEKKGFIKEEVILQVENLLRFWENQVIHDGDDVFYGLIDSDLLVHPHGEKHLVLTSRLIWTFSSAYRILKKDSYKRISKRVYNFFISHFLDKEYGGAFWRLTFDGHPIDTDKRVYGQAFVIYALSEYYRTFGDEEALKQAIILYRRLETYAYDKENKGYFEALLRDWEMDYEKQVSNINPFESASKTMNTHLHLLEAYTSLYRVWKDSGLKDRLKEHVHILTEKIIDHNSWHFMLYFDDFWQSQSPIISYGHDIEGSWLIWEAAWITEDSSLAEYAKPISLKMAEAILNKGWHPQGGIIYESDPEKGTVQKIRSWWVQSEAVVGFYNAWQLGGDKKYLDASLKVYEFINKEMIDHKNFSWFPYAISDNKKENRVDGWTCPYHNARMFFEIIERLK